MKKIFYLAIAIATITSCKKEEGGSGPTGPSVGPQITSISVINSMAANTKISGYRLDSGKIAFPTVGVNFDLNYLNVADTLKWKDSLKTPNRASDYPTATYMQGINRSLLGFSIAFNQFYSVNNSAWQNLGSYMDLPINTSLSSYTVKVDPQASKNNPIQTVAKFPLQYSDSFAENSSAFITLNISGRAKNPFGNLPDSIDFNTPLIITNSYAIKSKNIAYGNMKIKGYTDTLATVIQKYDIETTTTFTTGNAIYDGVLNSTLKSYGFENGQKNYTREYNYWVKNKGLVMSMGQDGRAYIRTGL